MLSVMAGCYFASDPTPEWLPRYGGEVNGDDAHFEGTLVLQGRCLYVDDGPTRYFPIFPENSTLYPEDGRLTVLGKDFEIGGKIEGGGSDRHNYATLKLDYVARPDPSCDTSLVWIVGHT